MKETAPTVNQTAANLTATNASGAAKIIFIRFSIPQSYYADGNTLLRKATPRQAILRLTRAAGSGGTLNVYAASNLDTTDTIWTSTSITFNNKPTIHSGTANLLAPGIAFPNTTDYVFNFDVTDYISGPGEYTFCVRCSNTTSDVSLYGSSATNARKPALFLTAPTHPATIAYPASPPAPKRTEFDRLMRDVMARGNAYKARYIALNTTGASDVNLVGYFDVTKSPYDAKGNWTSGDNGADDTVAIQRAINEARDARVALYFPAGKQFRVTAPLECVQGIILYENANQIEYVTTTNTWVPPNAENYYENTGWERWNHREFPCVLMGPALSLVATNRPLLVAGGSTTSGEFGSGKPSGVPLLHFWSRGTGEGGTPPTENYPAASYNHLVRNLDINLNQRPQAIGISMVGAQGTAIESLKITATNSYAGISGLPGAGGCTSAVTIFGGQFGIDAFKTTLDGGTGITSVLNNCTIDGTTNTVITQTNSVRWNHYGPLVLVGCNIKGGPVEIAGPGEESASPPTGGEGGETARGNLSIADSTIERSGTATSRPAIKGSRSAYLRNVYLKNVTQIADIDTTPDTANEPGPIVPTTTGWFFVKEYAEGAMLDQYKGKDTLHYDYLNDSPDEVDYTRRYVNGAKQSGPLSYLPLASFPVGAPPAGFFTKHIWPEAIDWTSSDVINVKSLNTTVSGYVGAKIPSYGGNSANGDNTGDDYPAFVAAINYAAANGKKVFVPVGQYPFNSPLTLASNTVLFGLHRSYSVLKANDAAAGFPATDFGDADRTALINTLPDDGSTSPPANTFTTKLTDVALLQRMTAANTYLINWKAGADSTVQNVNFNRQTVNAAKFAGVVINMNTPLIEIGALGGGKWYSMFHLSGGNTGPNYRNIKIVGSSSRALKFYMFNPELDAGADYNAEITYRTNLDVFGSKAEGRHTPFVRLANCVDVRWFGFGGNAYCNSNEGLSVAASQAVIEIEDCPSILLSSSSFHPNFLNPGPAATDPLKFYRLKEMVGTNYNTTPGHLGFVFFRRDPGNTGIIDID